jgi:hypothetical protein
MKIIKVSIQRLKEITDFYESAKRLPSYMRTYIISKDGTAIEVGERQ